MSVALVPFWIVWSIIKLPPRLGLPLTANRAPSVRFHNPPQKAYIMRRAFLCTPALLLWMTPALTAQNADDKAHLRDFFEKKIRPVFVEHCQRCHGAKKQSGELRFDRRDAVMKGDDDGPILVAGQPEKSRLIRAAARCGRAQDAA